MKILAWNRRGLTRASAIRSLRVKVRKFSPDILFLSETKTTVVVYYELHGVLFDGSCSPN
jgi:exonuclease III